MKTHFNGTLSEVLPLKTGPRKPNDKYPQPDWKKQEFVVTGFEQGKLCFCAWDDMISTLERYKKGDMITVEYVIASKEHEGKYYTQATAIRVTPYINPTEAKIISIARGLENIVDIAHRLKSTSTDDLLKPDTTTEAKELVKNVHKLIADINIPDEYKKGIDLAIEHFNTETQVEKA